MSFVWEGNSAKGILGPLSAPPSLGSDYCRSSAHGASASLRSIRSQGVSTIVNSERKIKRMGARKMDREKEKSDWRQRKVENVQLNWGVTSALARVSTSLLFA